MGGSCSNSCEQVEKLLELVERLAAEDAKERTPGSEEDELPAELRIELVPRMVDHEQQRRLKSAAVDLAVDLAKALQKARRRGTLTSIGTCVLYFRFVRGDSFPRIGKLLHMEPRDVVREYVAALAAVKRTGALKGYEKAQR